jgi:hypothetical protein
VGFPPAATDGGQMGATDTMETDRQTDRQTDRTLEQQQAARILPLWGCISVNIPSCRQGQGSCRDPYAEKAMGKS